MWPVQPCASNIRAAGRSGRWLGWVGWPASSGEFSTSAVENPTLGGIAVKVKTTNDADLRTINPSAIYMIRTPKKRSRTEAIKVYALIERFAAKRAVIQSLNAQVRIEAAK